MGLGDVAPPVRPHGPEVGLAEARVEERQSLAEQRPGRVGEAAVTDLPNLLARGGQVGHGRLGPRAEHERAAVNLGQQRRAVGLPQIAVSPGEVGRAIGLPDRLAGVLVQGREILHVDAVEVQDQQVAVEDRRGAGAAEMIAVQVVA